MRARASSTWRWRSAVEAPGAKCSVSYTTPRLYWSCRNPALVSTCEYTRIQNCTSRSRACGRGIGSSARAGAPGRSAKAAKRLHTSARAARGALVARRSGVEFIYTPAREHLPMCVQGVAGPHVLQPQSVSSPNASSNLTLWCLVPCKVPEATVARGLRKCALEARQRALRHIWGVSGALQAPEAQQRAALARGLLIYYPSRHKAGGTQRHGITEESTDAECSQM